MECNFSTNQALLFVVSAQVSCMLHFFPHIWMITIINVEGKKNNNLAVYVAEHPFSRHHPKWEFQRLFKQQQEAADIQKLMFLNHKNITSSTLSYTKDQPRPVPSF